VVDAWWEQWSLALVDSHYSRVKMEDGGRGAIYIFVVFFILFFLFFLFFLIQG